MANSTSTLLQVVNKILLNVGERQVTSFQSPVALKALNSIEEALREIENLDDWSWTREVVTATSWVNEVATLPTFTRIHDIYFVSSSFKTALTFIDSVEFALSNVYPFTIDNVPNTFSRYYTINNDSTVSVQPYPNDTTTRSYVKFVISSSLSIPQLITDTLPLPERYVVLVIKLASYNMAVRHLEDTNVARNFRSEFEASLAMLRSRGNLIPTSGHSMYRQRRRVERLL